MLKHFKLCILICICTHLVCEEPVVCEEPETIEQYRSLIAKGGSLEEMWQAKCKLAELNEKSGSWEEALHWYLEAFQHNPQRADPLLKVARHYRLAGQNDLAHLFAKYGASISNDFSLSYQFDEELSIVSYYTRYRQDGANAINNLILKKGIPPHLKDQAYQNLLFYLENLPGALFQPILCPLPPIHEGMEEKYHPMNPSILKTKEGYKLILRSVNYTQKGAKIFETSDPTGVFRTRNFFVTYDRDFRLLSQQEIIEDLPRSKMRVFNVEGMEDCRLFEWSGSYWFTCTTFDTNPNSNLQISLCQLENNENKQILNVTKLLPLKGPDLNRCEKNWLPFIHNNSLQLVYSSEPFTIFQPNLHTGSCDTILAREYPFDFSRFRGSAPPIPFDDGYLMLVHEVIFLPEYFRCYLHRFVYLDKNFSVSEVSRPFTFLHQGVEFCISMTIDHSGKQLILPIGVEDKEAYLCFVPLDKVRSLLKPLISSTL